MNRYVLFLFCSFLFAQSSTAQTIWDGPKMTFTKAGNADWTLEENQDRITEDIWITRRDRWSIFNIAEGEITSKPSCGANPGQPFGTRWAWGSTADGIENLMFDNFLGADFANCKPGEAAMMDRTAVLHLVEDDIYIDIKFLDWSSQSGGALVSYERSSDPTLSSVSLTRNASIQLFPNPAQNRIQIIGLENERPQEYIIYSTAGSIMDRAVFKANESIDIEALPEGMYYVQIGVDYQILKFVKH
ncbi:MAG: T9SS type A sorting domain-containing protein [Bacteroidota bacterium]